MPLPRGRLFWVESRQWPSYVPYVKRYAIMIAIFAAAGCTAQIGSAPAASSVSASSRQELLAESMTVPGSKLIVPLRTRPDGTPSLTISPPAHWTSNWEAGDDTRRHYLRGDGVVMTIETWAYEPTWACRAASCGLSSLIVDGLPVKLLRLAQPRSISAFIPRRSDPSRRGVSVWASCDSEANCKAAEQAIASIRGF